MRKYVFSVISAILAAILLSATAFAARGVKLSGVVTFDLGYLIVNGTLTGLGNTDVTVLLDGSGTAIVSCTNKSGSQAPGHDPVQISASGLQLLPGDELIQKNGKSSFRVEIGDQLTLSAIEAGCPNDNWTAHIDFIFWDSTTITVLDTVTQDILLRQDFVCVTTSPPFSSISCVRIL